MFFKRRQAAQENKEPAMVPARNQTDQAVAKMAHEASGLGKESAELNGLIEDLAATSAAQKETFKSLAKEIEAMVRANEAIEARTRASTASVKKARDAVEHVGRGVTSVTDKLAEVAKAAQEITQVALQTRLVAFNASVEAKRAGEAGRGFGVVAEAVKDLASKVEQSSKSIATTIEELDARIAALAADIHSSAVDRDDANKKHGFDAAVSEVELSVEDIAVTARQNMAACAGVLESVGGLSEKVDATAGSLQIARKRTEGFLSLSESLIDLVAQTGVHTEDTPIIEAAIATTARISGIFEEAVQNGQLTMADLFEERYQKIPNTNPEQFIAPFTQFCDQNLQNIFEDILTWSPKVIFGVVSDHRCYVPTHHKHCSKPQVRDPVWNATNCRNRRFFIGRTELAAVRSKRPFLMQTYRRDMGGGNFVILKSLSVPLYINGQHWGVLRMGYQF